MEIITTLLKLKQVFAEQGGLITQITLDKKAIEALNKEGLRICSRHIIGECPMCGRICANTVLGIGIKEHREDCKEG
jgi:hypothetical protein